MGTLASETVTPLFMKEKIASPDGAMEPLLAVILIEPDARFPSGAVQRYCKYPTCGDGIIETGHRNVVDGKGER